MAKMCPDYNLHLEGLGKCRGGKGKCECPKNTDAYCQIIPRREKMVRVKAWAIVRDEHEVEAVTPQPKHFRNAYVPCTILIPAKYLKGGK